MIPEAKISRLRFPGRSLACLMCFGVAVLLMAASAPQCARTSDAPLGVASALGPLEKPTGCRASCLEAADTARRAERQRFMDAIRNCQGEGCRQAEAAVHASIMQEIGRDEAGCAAACHNQGEGSGGN